MRVRRLPLILPVVLAAGIAVSGCVAPARPGPAPTASAAEFNDPYEDTNRQIFRFNQAVDRSVLVPAAEAYRTVLPPPVRQSVHDFLQNLNNPLIFAHDVLQARPDLAANTLGRFVMNSTLGVGGMFDVASRAGIPYHPNDLGITLAHWGFGEGPYLMLPVLGPSNVRDTVGLIGDSVADPGDIVASQHHLLWASIARSATSGIDERSRNIESLADIEKTSLDYYATIRSLYHQRREAQIRHEQSNLPNPGPLGGSDSGPQPAISYTLSQPQPPAPTPPQVPAK
jgi:phospholipid-binding lipoprotein MlaA